MTWISPPPNWLKLEPQSTPFDYGPSERGPEMQARFLPHAAVAVACQTLFALAISVFAMGQTASLSTNTLSFGNQPLGTTSAVQSVTVTNTGSATLTFSGIGVYGVEAADWAPLSNTCSGGLKPGHSCSVSAKFTPQAAGARSATIKITDNAPNSPQQVALTGTGVAAVVSFSVPNLSFAVQTVGFSSSPQPVTLTNSGTANLTISSIVSKGDYTQSNNCPSSIAPNGSCTINVTFTPEVAWARMGTIIVTGNVIAPPLFLSGMGSSGGSVSSSAQSLAFASQVVGSASTPQLVTLTNIGSAAVTISGISVSGDYTESNDCDGLLSLGANCQINVTFTPTWSGSRSGKLVVTYTDPPELQVISLSGTGQSPSTTVAISPRQVSLTAAQTAQYQATISGVSNTNVNWAVDGIAGGNGTVGTISTSGLYTPVATAGRHSVTATSIANPTQSASVPVFVTSSSGVLTSHNDNERTGQNLSETVLTTSNVNSSQFGKLFSYALDGYVYAQPLYVEGVSIPSQGRHNVVFVATEHDSVYALDADGPTPNVLWHTTFIDPANSITTVPSTDITGGDLIPEIGITGTPVIDPSNNAFYVVVATKELVSGAYQYFQRLHALNMTTGADMAGSPIVIAASVPGKGSGQSGGKVAFNTLLENQRPALLLLNSVIYVAWGSHNDQLPYHGWVIGYNEASLQMTTVFNATPNAAAGGIWQGGAGPAADGNGNIFVATSNGTFDANLGGIDYGDSFLRLSTTSGALALADYFSPYNQGIMSTENLDLGSGGALVLPDQPGPVTHLLVGGGKTATIYLIDRDSMGGYGPGSDSIVQELEDVLNEPAPQVGIRGLPAYWNGHVYTAGVADAVKAFELSNGLLSTFPFSKSPTNNFYPGGTPSVSSNSSSSGLLWVLQTDGFTKGTPAILHVYDANNVANELYNSNMDPSRDAAGPAVKFAVPTVVNGKAYVGAQSQLDVYGLLP